MDSTFESIDQVLDFAIANEIEGVSRTQLDSHFWLITRATRADTARSGRFLHL